MKRNLCVLCLFVCITANAAVVWDGTSAPWTKGSGTKADPYLIETPANLKYLADIVNAGRTFADTYFLQTADFDLNNANKFACIGNSTEKVFSGNYNGNEYQILNTYSYLFGYIKSATIQNITIAGTSSYPLIQYASGNTTLVNCINRSTTNVHCAGIIESATDYILILSCKNFAKITTSGTDAHQPYDNAGKPRLIAGGIIAVADSIHLGGSRNRGDIALTDNYNRTACVGGVIGYVHKYALIERCCNQSSINFDDSASDYVAGIIGAHNTNSKNIIINWCYNWGDISGTGIASNASITNSYCTGKTKKDAHELINNSYVSNSYFTNNGNGIYYYDGEYQPKLLAELKTPDFLSLLNADSTYFCKDYTNVNQGYPTFLWVYGRCYNIRALYKSEQGTVSGTGEYPQGAQVKLTATPKDNYTFIGWSDGSTDNPRTISVDTLDATYVAQFDRLSYTVYVNQDCSITVE